MHKSLKTTAISGALLAAFATSAMGASGNCAARDKVVGKLSSGYGETFAGGGLQNSNRIYEVWLSEEKGTWTILMTRPDGSTCVMASGTHWREGLPAKAIPKGTPS